MCEAEKLARELARSSKAPRTPKRPRTAGSPITPASRLSKQSRSMTDSVSSQTLTTEHATTSTLSSPSSVWTPTPSKLTSGTILPTPGPSTTIPAPDFQSLLMKRKRIPDEVIDLTATQSASNSSQSPPAKRRHTGGDVIDLTTDDGLGVPDGTGVIDLTLNSD